MRIGVLGTGIVGTTLASRLVKNGHLVRLGSRTVDNVAAAQWVAGHPDVSGQGTFASVAGWAELVINATGGLVSLEVLAAAGAHGLAGKVLIDVANPLDFSAGFPPTVVAHDGLSLGEQIQLAFPDALVVKSLNTMNADVMVHPRSLSGSHSVFVASDHSEAKQIVSALLQEFGWTPGEIVDAGGISASRGLELYLPLWLSLMGAMGSSHFNVAVVR
jgi:predicted dinucleotide-binding enzyme